MMYLSVLHPEACMGLGKLDAPLRKRDGYFMFKFP